MLGINELFPTTDSLLVDDGSLMSVIEDPLKLSQGIGIFPNNSSNALIGYPSADLIINNSLSSTPFEEQFSIASVPPFFKPNSSNISTTSLGLLTGTTSDDPLVGFLNQDEAIYRFLNTPPAGKNNSHQPIDTKSLPISTNSSQRLNQLTPEILEKFRSEAIARWASAGITPGEQGILKEVQLAIADLPSLKLGLTQGNVVTIDQDAAGAGWFIDSSPSDDVEFSNIVSASELQAIENDSAFGRVDLLTVMTHEFGHVLGLDHLDTNQVMSEALAIGTRHLPTQEILENTKADQPINEALELNLPTISTQNGIIDGNLSTTDAINPTRSGSYSDDYQLIDFTVGKLVTLNLSSPSFDTYLQLINIDTGQVIAEDNYSGTGYNSLLIFTPIEGINYIVRSTSYSSSTTGTYNLIATSGAPDLVITDATAPSTAPERSNISLTWTVTNQGEAVATNDWYDYVYLSDNTIFDNSDRYVGYLGNGDKIPLAPGASYISTQDMALPERVGAGKQYLLFVADQDNNIIESSETNNVRAVPIDITVPDLVVTGATAPIAVTVSSTAEVSWTVLNQGNVQATHSWYDAIYLSNDQTLDESDTQVNGFDSGISGTPLLAGDTYTLTKTLNIPNTALGNRYLLFVADADNYQYETNENNNVKAISVEVKAPDLIITAGSAPVTAGISEEITVNWTVANQGDVVAGADWYDYFFLSDDPIYDNSDQFITYEWTGEQTPLSNNTTYTATHTFNIPSNAKAGNRYLLVVADRDNYQEETNENNNFYAIPIIIKAPDLTLTDATASANSADPGATLSVSYTVKNQGEVSANQDWYDRIFLSYDEVWDSSDTYLNQRYTSTETPLAVNATYTVNNLSFTLPGGAIGQAGNRYLVVVTDAYGNYQSETNDNNNFKAIPLTITGANADLTLTAINAPTDVTTQQNIMVAWTGKNIGNLSTSASYWYDRVYISSDAILDTSDTYLNETYGYRTLTPGQEYSQQLNVAIPQGRTGTQYLLVVADNYNSQGEINETNNVRALQIEVKTPDLQVTASTTPTQAYAGARIEVSWTVQNQGNGSALTQWYDSVYLSDDDTLSTATDILGVADFGYDRGKVRFL